MYPCNSAMFRLAPRTYNSLLMRKTPLWIFRIAILVSVCGRAMGDDLSGRTIPGKWFEPMVPETDQEPQYPDYYAKDLLAQAKMQVDAGQYRRALVTASRIASQNAS